jgi:hypothetical protein
LKRTLKRTHTVGFTLVDVLTIISRFGIRMQCLVKKTTSKISNLKSGLIEDLSAIFLNRMGMILMTTLKTNFKMIMKSWMRTAQSPTQLRDLKIKSKEKDKPYWSKLRTERSNHKAGISFIESSCLFQVYQWYLQ